MHLRASHKSSRLPKRFPVGATYVVEGRAGARGQLLVCSRYVVLPGGRRIDIRPRPPAQPRAVPPKRTSGHRKPAPVKDSHEAQARRSY